MTDHPLPPSASWIGRATNPDDDRFTVRALTPWGPDGAPPHNSVVEVRMIIPDVDLEIAAVPSGDGPELRVAIRQESARLHFALRTSPVTPGGKWAELDLVEVLDRAGFEIVPKPERRAGWDPARPL